MKTHKKQYPQASIIIPCKDEEKWIGPCLSSLLSQDYPDGRLEIVLVDGQSEDKTLETVKGLAEKHRCIKLVSNPKKIIPSALNIGIAHANGEVILRADAHTIYEKDYVRISVELLMETEASNVGGVILPIGKSVLGKAIALGVSSPFGVGNAYYRFSTQSRWVDTVAFGCWRKNTLLALGGYDESYIVNEDYELNYRLRKSGGKILLSPKIRSYYVPRSTIPSLFKQYFRYGKWKIKMLVNYPESVAPRQTVPPLFVASFIASILLVPVNLLPAAFFVTLYGAGSLLFSVLAVKRKGLIYLFLLPIVFFTIHFSWGLGFFNGIKTFGWPNFFRRFNKKKKAAKKTVKTI